MRELVFCYDLYGKKKSINDPCHFKKIQLSFLFKPRIIKFLLGITQGSDTF